MCEIQSSAKMMIQNQKGPGDLKCLCHRNFRKVFGLCLKCRVRVCIQYKYLKGEETPVGGRVTAWERKGKTEHC